MNLKGTEMTKSGWNKGSEPCNSFSSDGTSAELCVQCLKKEDEHTKTKLAEMSSKELAASRRKARKQTWNHEQS